MTLWTVAHQIPLSLRFSRQEYWNGLPCPPPGDLPDSGMKSMPLMSPALAARFFTTSISWEAPRQGMAVHTSIPRPRVSKFLLVYTSEIRGYKLVTRSLNLVFTILKSFNIKIQIFTFFKKKKIDQVSLGLDSDEVTLRSEDGI